MVAAKLFALPLAALALAALIVFSILAMPLNTRIAYAADDLWYPGEGVKQDMYVKYRIQEQDTNANRPFEMTMYFENQVDVNWMVPTFVVDQGTVINGTMKLADNMAALSGANIPDGMRTYVSAYQGSLHWLDAFTTKTAPLSLNDANWGKIASIGGQEIKPMGTEKVSFAGAQDLCQADSCDATLIQWRKGVDSKVWIFNEFPFPVKAEAYADVTTGQQPIQFKFELLETGTGRPETPLTDEEIPVPPLDPKRTPRGTYEVVLDWVPPEIVPGSTVAFGIELRDSTGFPLERVNYDFTVKDVNGNIVREFKNQNADLGSATHEVQFNSSGRMTVNVKINSISGAPAGGGTFTEAVDFSIVVVPEFPFSAALVAAVVIGLVVTITRGGSVGRLFGRTKAM